MAAADAGFEGDGVAVVVACEDLAAIFDEVDGLAVGEGDGDFEVFDAALGGGFDALAERFVACVREVACADGDRARDGLGPCEDLAVVGEFVDLVQQDDQLGATPGDAFAALAFFDVLEEIFEGADDGVVLHLGGAVGDVEDDEEDVGVGCLFQGCSEAGDEVGGEVADESDGVREHDAEAAAEVPLAGAADERGEDAIVGVRAAGGEGVEEGGLAGVGVSDEADGEVVDLAVADLAAFAFLDFVETCLEVELFALDESAVDFELLLAGATCADAGEATAADDAFEVVPHGAEAREGVLELGELDLELGFVAGGAAGEDVEDQFTAVDDFAPRDFFDGGELLGGEVVVEDDGGGVDGVAKGFEFVDFTLAHVGAGDGALHVLGELADDCGAGLFGEGAEFAEGVGFVEDGIGEAHGGEDGAFGLQLNVGAFFGCWHGVGRSLWGMVGPWRETLDGWWLWWGRWS